MHLQPPLLLLCDLKYAGCTAATAAAAAAAV
jgi:hypothetical protein